MLPLTYAHGRYPIQFEIPDYANAGGMGDRRDFITISEEHPAGDGDFVAAGTLSALVNGARTDTTFYWNTRTITNQYRIIVDCGRLVVFNGLKFYQSGTATHGVWRIKGSVDLVTENNLGNTFTLGTGASGATPQEITTPSDNTTPYRYLILEGVSGATNQGSWPYIACLEFSVGNVVESGDSHVWNPQGVVLTADSFNEQLHIQEPNVLYENGTFKMWYSGGFASSHIFYATSSDGVVWTKYSGDPIIADHTRAFVLKDDATYVMFAHGSEGLNKLSSADGISWSVVATNVLAGGSSGAWDDGGIQNVCVWIEGETWYMLYEGSDGSHYQIGLATSDDGGETWSKSLSNPVIPSAIGSRSGPWVYKSGNMYYVWVQRATVDVLQTDILRYSSANLTTWSQTPLAVAYPRTTPDEGYLSNAGQVADVSLVYVSGIVYMYYSGHIDGSIACGTIKLATYTGTLNGLCADQEQISESYKAEKLRNFSFERVGAGGADVFEHWLDDAQDGAIVRTTTAGEFRAGTSGIAAAKLISGPSFVTTISQTITAYLTPGVDYILSGWGRGDGTNPGRLRVYSSVEGDLIDFATAKTTPSATYAPFSFPFTAPASGGTDVYVYGPEANDGYCCVDDLSIKPA